MYLSKLEIKNFRGIKDLSIECQDLLNVFVGKNSTGKSTIIDAIRLALGTSINNPNPLWITEDDFYRASPSNNREESFSIKMEFANLSEKQRTKFFEIVNFNLAELEKSTANLEYNASYPLKEGSKISVKRCGGPDKSEVPQKIMEQFSITYLPALRDAGVTLSPGNRSQLALLLKGLASENDKDNVAKLYKKTNEELSKSAFINTVVTSVNEFSENVVKGEIPKSSIVASDPDFMKILRTLQVRLEDSPAKDICSNGLGLQNILYMAVILQYLKNLENDECPILLIEEPEAHLHPQLILALSRVFKNNGVQSFMTTHSPTLVTDIPLEDIFLLYKRNENILCNSLKKARFDVREKRQFARLMDITRSTLYFAKGVILVEGICESLLIPVLAQRLGYDLRKDQISVIPICGVAFEIFSKIFTKDVFDIPVAIITDADPKITWPQRTYSLGDCDGLQEASSEEKDQVEEKIRTRGKNWREAFVDWKALGNATVCSRTTRLIRTFENFDNVTVFHSKITLEYDLANSGENNPLVMAEAWEKISNSGSSKNLNKSVIENLKTLDDKSLWIWRSVCLAESSYSKGDLANSLADLLENNKSNAEYFTVPKYITDAVNFVEEKIYPKENVDVEAQ